MGRDEKIDDVNFVCAKIVFDFLFTADVSGVYKNVFIRSFYKDAFRLAYVDKMNFGFGRFADFVLRFGKYLKIRILADDSVFIKGCAEKKRLLPRKARQKIRQDFD